MSASIPSTELEVLELLDENNATEGSFSLFLRVRRHISGDLYEYRTYELCDTTYREEKRVVCKIEFGGEQE